MTTALPITNWGSGSGGNCDQPLQAATAAKIRTQPRLGVNPASVADGQALQIRQMGRKETKCRSGLHGFRPEAYVTPNTGSAGNSPLRTAEASSMPIQPSIIDA